MQVCKVNVSYKIMYHDYKPPEGRLYFQEGATGMTAVCDTGRGGGLPYEKFGDARREFFFWPLRVLSSIVTSMFISWLLSCGLST